MPCPKSPAARYFCPVVVSIKRPVSPLSVDMKHTFAFVLSLLFFTLKTQAQKSVQWQTNYDTIMAQAVKENKPVLLFFHGSDWCPPCIKMQKEVFKTSAFADSTQHRVLFLDVDFPLKTRLPEVQQKHNFDVKKRMGLPETFYDGYPQVIIVDPAGKLLYKKKGYYGGGPDDLINTIKYGL
jgi:thioredoxin-related protein